MFEKDKACSSNEISGNHIGRVINFMRLNRNELLKLKRRVAMFNGLIRIFIHPFYEEYDNSRCWRNHLANHTSPRIDTVNQGLTRILSKSPERTPTTFVFEETLYLTKTENRLVEINKYSGNDVYIVPTHSDTSFPEDSNRKQYKDLSEYWSKFISKLHDLNVSQIIIGGNRLVIQPGVDYLNHKGIGYETYRCVGKAIDYLTKDFQIIVSGLAHPHSRVDINFVGPKYENMDKILQEKYF